MEWTDGSTYEGEWKNGIQHGWGKMSFPNGKVTEGYFEDNVFKADVTYEQYLEIKREIQEQEYNDESEETYESEYSENDYMKSNKQSKPTADDLVPDKLDLHIQDKIKISNLNNSTGAMQLSKDAYHQNDSSYFKSQALYNNS